ncbi:putative retrotransposon hot spot (RHS) protein, partial [Trypanosoma cruzi]
MSGRPEERLYGNVESQSSNVSQGGRRRARSEFEGDTDYSSATRRRLEETRRPEWTMSSTVKDILLEGSTNSTEMKLNDFLRSHLGGRAAVDEDYNVTMEAFVQEPDAYVQDQELLRRIINLPAYQALEERKILLEAIYKLHHEGVYFLRQWRDYQRNDTLTPLASGKLNGVLTDIEEKENREAEERLRREEAETQRRAQEIIFTMSTNIEVVLFRGRARVKEMKLNDFLTLRFGGKGVMDTNRNVLLEEFFKEPARYIGDEGVLNEIKTSYPYLRMEWVLTEETILERDILKLQQSAGTLAAWSLAAEEVKAGVHDITKQTLDAALEEVRNPAATTASIKLEGCYESVYNARWHHVVEVPGGEGTGMKVHEGEPPQPWTYKAVGRTLEKDDGVEQSGEARLRLMVLTSDKGWPYTWRRESKAIRDCYVNCEVERVWQFVKGDLTEWFINFHLILNPSPLPRVLIGTPGIGKSMAAGSYLLYQLLHYDVERLQMVAYYVGDESFLFDKTTKTVTKYKEGTRFTNIVKSLFWRGFKGYIIYDIAKDGCKPSANLPCDGWGMIVLTSPNEGNFSDWEKEIKPTRIVINCPEKDDVKAICVWMRQYQSKQEQEKYWREVKDRMEDLGPLLRYIFIENEYKDRNMLCEKAVREMTLPDTNHYLTLGTHKMWDARHVSHKLVKIVRVRGDDGELTLNSLISPHLGSLMTCKLAQLMM